MTVWHSKLLNANGKREVVFTEDKSDGQPSFKIPCGQCTGCRIARSSDWTTRLVQESKFFLESCFITLTYNDEHLPEHGTLVKRDVQLFYKRLRFEFEPRRLRHFTAGEYGEQTARPHYHALLFGLAFLEDRRPHSKNKQGDQLYTSETLDRLWGKGHCLIGNITVRSCSYVAQYAFKKINGKRSDEHYRRVDPVTGETWLLQKEFALMSTHPGIGYEHYNRYADNMFARGSVIDRGRELPIPKYYDRLLKRDDPLRLESIKTGRFEDAQQRLDDQTPERLAVKEQIMLAKRKQYLNKVL